MINSINNQFLRQKCQNLADEIADNLPISSGLYEAFLNIPRELFVPNGMERHAYKLDALPMSGNQWISSPLTVARMTNALDVDGVDSVLEIGCGSGYQAAILSQIARRVFTVERIESLLKEAKGRFSTLGLNNIHTRFDDGQRGWKSYAPYERILFSASIPSIPQTIFSQLQDGGILVAPIEKNGKQIIIKYIKDGDNIIEKSLDECLFVSIINGTDKF